MIEFALMMQTYSSILKGRDSKVVKEFGDKAQCYAKKMQDFLLNENIEIYADYVSL